MCRTGLASRRRNLQQQSAAACQPQSHSPSARSRIASPLPPILKTSRYLFLQGQIGPFFSELARALQGRGHAVQRIHFNSGDAQFWSLPGSVDFSGSAAEWPEFLAQHLARWGISDLILFGDCRPLHRAAIAMARACGITVHVFEEGYLRPDFVTLEQGGVNGYSGLPADAASYLQAAASLPPWSAPSPVAASFGRRALHDVFYNLSTVLGARRFPHYRGHRPGHPLAEYAVGCRRFPLKLVNRGRTARQARAIEQGGRPYFLFPLQLDADAQIRFHAPAGGMAMALQQVMQSFADHAPADALLVLTEHPLDYGPVDQQQRVAVLAAACGIGDRVVFLRGGSPLALIRAARGMVTVNSTIGITALAEGIPLVALGTAIYKLAGLTHALGLASFWQQPQPPEPVLFDAFRRVVAARTQINGGFYSAEGIARAVAGALLRLQHAAAELQCAPSRLPVVEADQDPGQDPFWLPPRPAAAQIPTQV